MTSYVYQFSITSPVPKFVEKKLFLSTGDCAVRDADFAILTRTCQCGRPNRLLWLRRQNTSHSVFPVGGQPLGMNSQRHVHDPTKRWQHFLSKQPLNQSEVPAPGVIGMRSGFQNIVCTRLSHHHQLQCVVGVHSTTSGDITTLKRPKRFGLGRAETWRNGKTTTVPCAFGRRQSSHQPPFVISEYISTPNSQWNSMCQRLPLRVSTICVDFARFAVAYPAGNMLLFPRKLYTEFRGPNFALTGNLVLTVE